MKALDVDAIKHYLQRGVPKNSIASIMQVSRPKLDSTIRGENYVTRLFHYLRSYHYHSIALAVAHYSLHSA